jgi:hypothetical protein
MLNTMADSWGSELADADFFRDLATETLCSARDNTWTPSLPERGGLYPLRTVMYLSHLESGRKVRAPLKVEVSPTDCGSYQVYSTVLDISGVGDSLAAATKDLCDTITSLWDEFSGTPTDRLAPDAVVLFERLRNAIG